MAEASPHYSEQHTVIVKNLSPGTTTEIIFETFKKFGFIKSHRVETDKKTGLPSRAFINYAVLNDARKAQKDMNNKKICRFRVKTSLRKHTSSTSSSNKINFQRLTDCLYFEQGNCNPKNGKVRCCVYYLYWL